MGEKKTLGGSKKLSFAPKKIDYNNVTEDMLINNEESETVEPVNDNKKNQKKVKKEKPKPQSGVAGIWSAPIAQDKFGSKGHTVEIVDEEGTDLHFEAEYEPQTAIKDKIENCVFGDDILYLFNGIDENEGDNFKVEVRDDGLLFLVIDDDVKYKMNGRECDKLTAVVVDDDIKEIGNLFSAFTVCRD